MNPISQITAFIILFVTMSSLSRGQNTSLVLDSVSVNQDNHVVISWNLETEIEEGYVKIERNLDDGTFNTVIRLPLSSDTFIDNSIDAQNRSYAYYVVPYDEFDDQIIPAEKIHSTIFLHQPTFKICEKEIYLQWDNYKVSDFTQFPNPVEFPFDSTSVYMSVNGSEYMEQGAISADSTKFTIPYQTNAKYCFIVRSFDEEGSISSASNTSCIDAQYVDLPGKVSSHRVSLSNDSENVEIDLRMKDPVADLTFVLEKFDRDQNRFVSSDSVVNTDNTTSFIRFYDQQSQANLFSESYRTVVLDSCMHVAQATDSVATIFLSASKPESDIHTLQWNRYNGWDNSDLMIDHYAVLRKTGDASEFEMIASLEPGSLSFDDPVGSVTDQDVFYRIVAVSAFSIETGSVVEVSSNIAAIENDPEVFIPNAFHPRSHIEQNRVFKPVFSNFTPSDYSMNIFNRWGESIFFTEDENDHWDGFDESRVLPAGLYYYVIQYIDSKGNEHVKRGDVLMIW